MTKTFVDDLEPLTTNQQQGWSLSSVQCPCDWMRVGTRSNSIFPTLLVERTEQTTLRRFECRSTPIAESEGSTFQTDCTQRRSCPRNSNFSCLCRSNKRQDLGDFKWEAFQLLIFPSVYLELRERIVKQDTTCRLVVRMRDYVIRLFFFNHIKQMLLFWLCFA